MLVHAYNPSIWEVQGGSQVQSQLGVQNNAGCQWLTLVILATQEEEIRRTVV
jgi:hypothetical protein